MNLGNKKAKGGLADFAIIFVILLALALSIIVLLNKPEVVTEFLGEQLSSLSPTKKTGFQANATNASSAISEIAATPTPAPSPTPSPTLKPVQCSPSGKCLATKPDYCLNGAIVKNCGQCGCPKSQVCKPEGCVPEKFA